MSAGDILREGGKRGGRVWLASELMYPELTSTGFYVAAIAECLARSWPVEVVCAQPTYAARGTRARSSEQWRGVDIRRTWGTTFNKNRLAGRIANLVTFSASVLLVLLRRLRRGDLVLVLTNPPTLPLVVALACRLKGARYAVLIHDMYPDTLVAVAGFSERSPLVRAWRAMNRRLFAGAAAVVVVGRDMRARLRQHYGDVATAVHVIANWGEAETVRPAARAGNALVAEHGLSDHFVVLYAGNLGRPNDLATIVEAAARLRDDPRVRFVFVGAGARDRWLRQAVQRDALPNVLVLGPRPRTDQQEFLNACDLAIVPFVRGMRGVAVPSRLYNFLAAGKPVAAIAEPDSEVDMVVRETGAGWVTPPHDVDAFVHVVREALADPARLARMGAAAREAADRDYNGEKALARYAALVDELLERAPTA